MKLKHALTNIPVVSPVLTLRRRLAGLQDQLNQVKQELSELTPGLAGTKLDYLEFKDNTLKHRDLLGEHLATSGQKIDKLIEKTNEMSHQIAIIERTVKNGTGSSSAPSSDSGKKLLADDHSLDDFYVKFENRFRGDEATIKERQKLYLPYIDKAHAATGKQASSVLDIGCGRGEFLELIREHKLTPIGLDLNITMVEEVQAKGIEATQQDAYDYLLGQKSDSMLAITGFQIVEHIPFDDLIRIFTECYRVLAPGGIIIFETPNPENIVVSAHTFRYDPSHLNPLPPNLLSFVVETRGFQDIEILRMHAVKEDMPVPEDPLLAELSNLIYGPRDYAVIAAKPKR